MKKLFYTERIVILNCFNVHLYYIILSLNLNFVVVSAVVYMYSQRDTQMHRQSAET